MAAWASTSKVDIQSRDLFLEVPGETRRDPEPVWPTQQRVCCISLLARRAQRLSRLMPLEQPYLRCDRCSVRMLLPGELDET